METTGRWFLQEVELSLIELLPLIGVEHISIRKRASSGSLYYKFIFSSIFQAIFDSDYIFV